MSTVKGVCSMKGSKKNTPVPPYAGEGAQAQHHFALPLLTDAERGKDHDQDERDDHDGPNHAEVDGGSLQRGP